MKTYLLLFQFFLFIIFDGKLVMDKINKINIHLSIIYIYLMTNNICIQ